MDVKYTRTGPVLEGRGPQIIDKALQQMEGDVADEALRRVKSRLHNVLKHPTGYYESRVVKTTRVDGAEVTDSRVIYGPWLEGVSSRNTRSRFKGYRSFQIVAQQLENDIPQIINSNVDRMMEELNGN